MESKDGDRAAGAGADPWAAHAGARDATRVQARQGLPTPARPAGRERSRHALQRRLPGKDGVVVAQGLLKSRERTL